jgi:hypothetical protein
MNIYQKYFEDRLTKLITFDKIRLYKLLEITQYTLLYLIISIPTSVIIEEIFPEVDESKSMVRIMVEIILQMILLSILVFYILKIIKLVPFILMGDKNYVAHNVFEYEGSVTLSFIMIGTQQNMISKIHIIRKRLKSFLKIDEYLYD